MSKGVEPCAMIREECISSRLHRRKPTHHSSKAIKPFWGICVFGGKIWRELASLSRPGSGRLDIGSFVTGKERGRDLPRGFYSCKISPYSTSDTRRNAEILRQDKGSANQNPGRRREPRRQPIGTKLRGEKLALVTSQTRWLSLSFPFNESVFISPIKKRS